MTKRINCEAHPNFAFRGQVSTPPALSVIADDTPAHSKVTVGLSPRVLPLLFQPLSDGSYIIFTFPMSC
jgi:hypothetical protein